MTVTCIVQARMGSTRLPGKVLMELGGRPMLAFLLERLSRADVDALVVATTVDPRDDSVADVAASAGAKVVRGPEEDVLQRFVLALESQPADEAVRITADCPLADPGIVAAALDRRRESGAHYTSNTLIREFPDGLDVEVVEVRSLLAAAGESRDPVEREHVTPFLYRRPERFRLSALRGEELLGDERWTVDTASDLEFLRSIVAALGSRSDFGWREALAVVGRRATRPPGALRLRPLLSGDAGLLLALRNDPLAVRFSQTGRAVEPGEHEAWFAGILGDPGRRIWIGEVNGRPVGQVRVDVTGGVGRVSIAVGPEHRGRGFATTLLAELQKIVLVDHQVQTLLARIHRDNAASIAAFRRARFQMVDDRETFLVLRWFREAVRA